MPPVEAKVEETVKAAFASKDDWFNIAGKLREAELEVEGLGKVLLSEITGTARAQIMSTQSQGLLADAKKIDAVAYQRSLLLSGVVDPASPAGARVPLFSVGDIDRVMKIGGRTISKIVDKIEELSALGTYQGSAEGNSSPTQNGAGTSG